MKSSQKGKSEHKYLMMGMLIGFGLGVCAGVVVCVIMDKNWGFGISIGAGVGMLLGITIGTALDYEAAKKQ